MKMLIGPAASLAALLGVAITSPADVYNGSGGGRGGPRLGSFGYDYRFCWVRGTDGWPIYVCYDLPRRGLSQDRGG